MGATLVIFFTGLFTLVQQDSGWTSASVVFPNASFEQQDLQLPAHFAWLEVSTDDLDLSVEAKYPPDRAGGRVEYWSLASTRVTILPKGVPPPANSIIQVTNKGITDECPVVNDPIHGNLNDIHWIVSTSFLNYHKTMDTGWQNLPGPITPIQTVIDLAEGTLTPFYSVHPNNSDWQFNYVNPTPNGAKQFLAESLAFSGSTLYPNWLIELHHIGDADNSRDRYVGIVGRNGGTVRLDFINVPDPLPPGMTSRHFLAQYGELYSKEPVSTRWYPAQMIQCPNATVEQLALAIAGWRDGLSNDKDHKDRAKLQPFDVPPIIHCPPMAAPTF